MYESKFGLSGPPFQLNPDPAFYFDSRGHSNALSYLKFGVHQGEGFIVVTGEIGAGKTTLVRTLLEGVNSDEVAAAQVLNTQLESGELLQAILTAFGVASPAGSKAQLLASLEAFLTSVAAEGRRALLVVDEAQNLGREAIEELRMLSNFQLGNHALLQSFLIGQPELRKQLESPAMEQLRQRVIASCHLGPLGAEETRAYIEHRLRHVGWVEQPSFDDAAFEVIHQWTGGIPRKINLLCNRLLLAAFLSDEEQITGALVRSTASDLARETGGARVPVEATPAPREQPALAAVAPMPSSRGAVAALPEEREIVRVAGAGVDAAVLRAPLVLLVDSPLGAFKAAVLAKALSAHEDLPPAVLVTPGEPGDADPGALAPGLSESLALQIHLRAGAGERRRAACRGGASDGPGTRRTAAIRDVDLRRRQRCVDGQLAGQQARLAAGSPRCRAAPRVTVTQRRHQCGDDRPPVRRVVHPHVEGALHAVQGGHQRRSHGVCGQPAQRWSAPGHFADAAGVGVAQRCRPVARAVAPRAARLRAGQCTERRCGACRGRSAQDRPRRSRPRTRDARGVDRL